MLNKVNAADLVNVTVMYGEIKELKEPKAVLEKLATINDTAVDCFNIEKVRLATYMNWLVEHEYKEWYDFIIESNRILTILTLGGTVEPETLPQRPEGFIPPRDYLNGIIPKAPESTSTGEGKA